MVLGDVELLNPKSLQKYTIPVIQHTMHDYVQLAYIRDFNPEHLTIGNIRRR